MEITSEKQILFIIEKRDAACLQQCLASIKALKVPEGYQVKTCVWELQQAPHAAAAYHGIFCKQKAKYRIYLDEKLLFINESFLEDMLNIFQTDEHIAALGLCGAKKIAAWETEKSEADFVGSYYCLNQADKPVEKQYAREACCYTQVAGLDGMLLATQIDLQWQDNYGMSAACLRSYQSMQYVANGYKVVVPYQNTSWCLWTGHKEGCMDTMYEQGKHIALQKYPQQYTGKYLFGALGDNTCVSPNSRIDKPQSLIIGNDVIIGDGFSIDAMTANNESSLVKIGDQSRIEKNCTFKVRHGLNIARGVILEAGVYISDQVSTPVFFDAKTMDSGQLYIGRYTYVGQNAVLQGKIKLGTGCKVLPNSFVNQDIPDYCEVAGSPARIIRVMNYESGLWEPVEDEASLQEKLSLRKNAKPVLTIGIPTYNRSFYLEENLRQLTDAVGNDALFEILISDNHSTDDTAEVVARYAKKYHNVRYHCNETNIGGRNFEMVWSIAKGEYVIALGDDDYVMPDVWQRIVQGIYQGKDIAVIGLIENKYPGAGCCFATGMDSYIQQMSYATTSISSFIFRQSYYAEIEDKLKFGDTCLNQVYLQLEILSKHPSFMLAYGHIWSYQTGYAAYEREVPLQQRGNYLKIFVQEYFDILESFHGKGLSPETIKFDKYSVLFKLILPRCETLAYRDNVWSLADDTLEIYTKYYRDEAYYLHGKERLEYYISQQNNLQG